MTLVVETGVGIREANSYIDVQYVTDYLTIRNRQTENSWSSSDDEVKVAAVVSATDYVDKRFGHRFKGLPKFTFEEVNAKAELSFSGLLEPTEELTLGDDIYTFVSSLSGDPYEVIISTSVEDTASNLEAAINGGVGAGVTYGLGTPQSRHATAKASGVVLSLTAKAAGSSGSLTVLEGDVSNLEIKRFSGGKDGGLQPLCWPRARAYDERGQEIQGIPDRLKKAVSEYAVRAVSKDLLPDPVTDTFGGRVNQRTEIVGPITESWKYDIGSAGTVIFSPFPAADRLIRPLLLGSGNGGVIRG